MIHVRNIIATALLGSILVGLFYSFTWLCQMNKHGGDGWYGALALLVFFAMLINLAAFIGSLGGTWIRATDREFADLIEKHGLAGSKFGGDE